MDMIGLPIELIAVLIAAFMVALIVFSVYMVIARHLENRRSQQASAYLETNRTAWYDYIRHGDTGEVTLTPKNAAEASAVEELFRSLVHNIKGDGMEKRISSFSNRHLAEVYRQRLKGGNWGKRVNTLYRIHDFGVDVLAADCRKMLERRVSKEELFLLLLIALKFQPESFLHHHLAGLDTLAANNLKELLFAMPDDIFEKTLLQIDDLADPVRYALVDVIGMKADMSRVNDLERLYSSPDNEQRIRVLRAFNSLSVLPSPETYEAAAASDVWQERYQAARMLKRMPQETALQLLSKFAEDSMFLVQEEAKQFSRLLAPSQLKTMHPQAAADVETKEWLKSDSAERERGQRR